MEATLSLYLRSKAFTMATHLLHRGRCQGGRADDVPGGVDVRDGRPVIAH